MATNPAVKEAYPFSTRDGDPIPLDVIGAAGLLVKSVGVGVTDFVIPASFVLGSLYCELGCIIQMGAQSIPSPLADATEYTDTIFVPPSAILTVALIPGNARVIPLSTATTLYMQSIRKWAVLALAQQVSRK